MAVTWQMHTDGISVAGLLDLSYLVITLLPWHFGLWRGHISEQFLIMKKSLVRKFTYMYII